MTLNELESNWNQLEPEKKSREELDMMTKIKNHPKIKRARLQFLIELIAITAFLILYYDGFDGNSKPLWVNIVLVLSALSYIFSRCTAWVIIRNPISGDNIKKSLYNFSKKLKQMIVLVVLTSLLFGLTVISFFASSIELNGSKYMVLIGMILLLLLMTYWSSRHWHMRIKNINKTLNEFTQSNE